MAQCAIQVGWVLPVDHCGDPLRYVAKMAVPIPGHIVSVAAAAWIATGVWPLFAKWRTSVPARFGACKFDTQTASARYSVYYSFLNHAIYKIQHSAYNKTYNTIYGTPCISIPMGQDILCCYVLVPNVQPSFMHFDNCFGKSTGPT